MAKVIIDPWLRELGPKGEEIVDASTVSGLLDTLEARYPRLRFRIRDETGAIRKFVRIFVDGEELDSSLGVAAPIGNSSTVDILHSIAGG